jgi:hypothetical protein
MEEVIIDGRKFVSEDGQNFFPKPTNEKAIRIKLAEDGLNLSVRQLGRLIRTYNNTGINMPIGALVKEIADGKRNDFYDRAFALNILCNG